MAVVLSFGREVIASWRVVKSALLDLPTMIVPWGQWLLLVWHFSRVFRVDGSVAAVMWVDWKRSGSRGRSDRPSILKLICSILSN